MPAPIIVALTFKRGAVGGCGSRATRAAGAGAFAAAVGAAFAFAAFAFAAFAFAAFALDAGWATTGDDIIMVPLKRPGAAFFSAAGNS